MTENDITWPRKGTLLPCLRAWRISVHITQRELAHLSGIAQSSIALLENEGQAARKVTIEKLASSLGITSHQLVNELPSLRGGSADMSQSAPVVMLNYRLPNGIEQHIPFPSRIRKHQDELRILETVIPNLFSIIPRRQDYENVSFSVGGDSFRIEWPIDGVDMDDPDPRSGVLVRPMFYLDNTGHVDIFTLKTEVILWKYELRIKTSSPIRYYTFHTAYLVNKTEGEEVVRFPTEFIEEMQVEPLEELKEAESCLNFRGESHSLSWPPPNSSRLHVRVKFTDIGDISEVRWDG
jgi:transcriptional regulator with XRE-family HTH domain